jgi:uncharacterized protein (TIGR03663 family)
VVANELSMASEQMIQNYDVVAASPRQSWLDKPLLATLNWEKTLYLLFIVVAIISRFYDIGARVMSHDESLHTYFSYNLAAGKGFQHTPLMHGPFLFHVTALSYFLFGANDTTSRLPFAIFGIVLVALPYLFRKELGRFGALATSLFILISPSILYHARYIRQEQTILVWTVLTVLCTWRYLETRKVGWLIGLSAALAFHATDKSTSFLSIALMLIFLAPLALWQLYRMRSKWQDAGMLVAFGVVTAVFMLGLSIIFELGGSRLSQALNLSAIITQPDPNSATVALNTGALLFVGIMLVVTVAVGTGLFYLYRSTFGDWMRQATAGSAALNVVIVMVTTTMFMGSPAMLLIKNRIWQLFRGEELVPISTLGTMSNLQSNPNVVSTMLAMSLALIAIAVAMGLMWDARAWLPIIGIFLVITVTFFTTVFTNMAGVGTGYVGQLGYWMAQQDVMRGNQPPYYYALIVPMYEYAVLIGTLCAITTIAIRLIRAARVSRLNLKSEIQNLLFPLFVTWWTIATWLIYTIAGEKMPWLSVHFALPMTFLTGWFLQRVVMQAWTRVRHLSRSRWLAVAVLSVLAVALFVRQLSLIGSINLAEAPRADGLQWIFNFVLGIFALAVVGYLLTRVASGAAWPGVGLASFALLGVLTIRTAVNVTYINYDYTKEFLFYAHGAPGVKIALNQVEDLERRVGGRTPLRIGYTQETSWPMSWYMQQKPGARFFGAQLPPDYSDSQVILASEQDAEFAQWADTLSADYTRFDYMLVWWPMQDYYDLNWERVSYSLFNPQARAALWEIVFNRNFEPYAKLFNKTSLTPETWSPGHRFSLFVRNDVANQLWDYRIGDVAAGGARPVSGPKIQSPAGITFAPDGTRYLIDHKVNRVFHQDADGNLIASFGGSGNQPGKFNDAWSIAVDAASNVYVADTFNHRIQKFDANGGFITAWGRPGATMDPGIGPDTQFFGPRDIVIDSQGRLLVTDTGNKRVQVFDANGNFLTQFGADGSRPGQFNEPVGLAIDGQGNVYVADTWNKRIQVFDSNFAFVREFPVATWDQMEPNELQNVDHKPYLAIDQNTLFVTSPGTAQVLAFTLNGAPVDLPTVTFDVGDLPTGIKTQNGTLFVTNARNGAIASFPIQANAQ